MNPATAEIIEVCEALLSEKKAEVIEFATILLARQDDKHWEQLLAGPQPRPRLEAFLSESAVEGEKPLDCPRR